MGAQPFPCTGAKADPTKVRIADLSESNVDPLARAVRHRLSRQLGIRGGIPVLLSTEKPRCRLVPIEEVGENPLDYQVGRLAVAAGPRKQLDTLEADTLGGPSCDGVLREAALPTVAQEGVGEDPLDYQVGRATFASMPQNCKSVLPITSYTLDSRPLSEAGELS